MSSYRILGVAAIGVVVICASVFGAGTAISTRIQRGDAERASAQLRAAQAEVERGLAAELKLRAGLLSADGPSLAYIADALRIGATPGLAIDSASISDLLAERRLQLGLDAAGVIDVEGRYVAGTRPWTDSGGNPGRHPLFIEARDGQRMAIGLVREDSRLFLGAIMPMVRGGAVDAWLYAASAIDDEVLQKIAALAPMELALVATAAPAHFISQVGDHAEASWTAALERAGSAPIAAALEVGGGGEATTLIPLFGQADQALLLARPQAVDAARGGIVGAPLLALAGVLSTLWLLLLAVWWRSTLQPAEGACALLERAARGDFRLRAPPWQGGLRGRFAVAFDALMLKLGSR